MRTHTVKAMALVLALAATPAPAGTLPAREVADMLYALALANRTVYTRDVVQRLGPTGESVVTATEHYLDARALPLPAQMFALVADEIDHTGYWLSLRSLDPINFANGPLTPLEEQGLAFVRANPGQAFYAEDDAAGAPSLVAIYADVASVGACVACHNAHPRSPRRDFTLGDVMGGVIVRVFLPRADSE